MPYVPNLLNYLSVIFGNKIKCVIRGNVRNQLNVYASSLINIKNRFWHKLYRLRSFFYYYCECNLFKRTAFIIEIRKKVCNAVWIKNDSNSFDIIKIKLFS